MTHLKNRNYKKFLEVEEFGLCDGNLFGVYKLKTAEITVDRRNKYFKKSDRLKKIADKCGHLYLSDLGTIGNKNYTKNEFSKIYLSNIGLWGVVIQDDSRLINLLNSLIPNGLVYHSDGQKFGREWNRLIEQGEIKLKMFEEIFIRDEILTEKAMELEKKWARMITKNDSWKPEVYRKIA